MDKGLILVIIGGLLSCTLIGVFVGVPLIFIGAYIIYKKFKKSDELSSSIEKKRRNTKTKTK